MKGNNSRKKLFDNMRVAREASKDRKSCRRTRKQKLRNHNQTFLPPFVAVFAWSAEGIECVARY